MKYKMNIMLMCAIAFLQGMVFYSSVSTLYRQAHGLSLLQMGMIESVLSVLIFLLEIPWGFVCEKIGYKKTMIICNLLYLMSKVVFWQADSFMMFLTEAVLVAVIVSGLSGCDSALIYLSAKSYSSTKIFGFYQAMGTLGMLLASMLFSVWVKDLDMAAFLTIFPYGLAFLLTLFLTDIKEANLKQKEDKKLRFYFSSLKRMTPFLIACALLSETTHMLGVFYNQLQYERAKIPLEFYGYIYTFVTLCTLSNALSGKIVKYMKEEKLILCLSAITAIVCFTVSMSDLAVVSVTGIMLLQVCEALFFPVRDTIMNAYASVSRAATLSVYSMMISLGCTVMDMSFGISADIGISYTFALGGVFSGIGFILFRKWLKAHKNTESSLL